MIVLTHKLAAKAYSAMSLKGVTPDRLHGLSQEELSELTLLVDGRPARLGAFWDVERFDDGKEDLLRLVGDCQRCIDVAGELLDGMIEVHGSVGDHLANGMRGGCVEVRGDAGRFAAGNLRGGLVRVRGNVGEFAAGAVPGGSRGMRGGTLVVDGDSDRWLAARMRRGLVITLGRVAGGAATRMIAGTLVLASIVDGPVGVGMRRGTIVHLESSIAENLSGFTQPELCELSFLPMLLQDIGRHLPREATSKWLAQRRVMRAMGDRGHGGLGECLWLPANEDILERASLVPS